MTIIRLTLDEFEDTLKVTPFQVTIRGKDRLVFENRLDQPLDLQFHANHPLPFARAQMLLPPFEKASFTLSKETHFSYQVAAEQVVPRPRPRSAILTVLQPVKGSADADRPRGSGNVFIGIELREEKQQITVDPPLSETYPGNKVLFINQTKRTLRVQFQSAAPFQLGEPLLRIQPLEKVSRETDTRLRFDFEVTAEDGNVSGSKGTLRHVVG